MIEKKVIGRILYSIDDPQSRMAEELLESKNVPYGLVKVGRDEELEYEIPCLVTSEGIFPGIGHIISYAHCPAMTKDFDKP